MQFLKFNKRLINVKYIRAISPHNDGIIISMHGNENGINHYEENFYNEPNDHARKLIIDNRMSRIFRELTANVKHMKDPVINK